MLICPYEYYLPTEEEKKETDSRVYGEDADQGWPSDAGEASGEEEMEAYRLKY